MSFLRSASQVWWRCKHAEQPITGAAGREMAAFLGLVYRQSGTDGRVRLLGVSKRGAPCLRTLLIHGARSAITQGSRPVRTLQPWIHRLLLRRPKNVAIVALANKLARIAWALLARGRSLIGVGAALCLLQPCNHLTGGTNHSDCASEARVMAKQVGP